MRRQGSPKDFFAGEGSDGGIGGWAGDGARGNTGSVEGPGAFSEDGVTGSEAVGEGDA